LVLTPAAVGRQAAFAAGFGSKLMVLREAPLFVGNAPAALSRDFPLFLDIHRRKTSARGVNVLSHGSAPNHEIVQVTAKSCAGSIASSASPSTCSRAKGSANFGTLAKLLIFTALRQSGT
jgi:hypothetical protein